MLCIHLLYYCKNGVSTTFKSPIFSYFFSTSSRKQHSSTTRVSEFLLHKHHFSLDAATQIASALNHVKNLEKYDSVLSFLKERGFSQAQLEKILLYRPRFLSANPEKVIKPKIRIFRELGFSSGDMTEIITNDPDILYRSLENRVIPSLTALKELLGSNMEVARVLKISGWFLKYDVESTMAPNFKFLRSCSIDEEQIIYLMRNFPRCLLCKPERMKKIVDRVDEMGIRRSSKLFTHAVRVLASMTMETWEQKLKDFRSLGFSEDDILVTFRKAPQVFSVSAKKLYTLKEVLGTSGKYDASSIINHPTSLMCSVENRYKPRLQVLKILESKNLIKDWPTFSRLYKMPDACFFERYVEPYLDEVGNVCIVGSTIKDKAKVKVGLSDPSLNTAVSC